MPACICGYNTAAQMARHQRTCKMHAIHDAEKRRDDALRRCDALAFDNERLCAENDGLRAEVSSLRCRLDEARTARPNVLNNVTINIAPYGSEAPLTNAQVRSILSSVPSESVPRYIEMKHFRRPETSNIRITNKRGRTLQIVEEDANKCLRWVDKDRKTMLSAITDTSLDELVAHFDADRYQMWNSWFEASGLKDEGYDKTDAFREIMQKVENVITSQSPRNAIG